MLDMTDGMVLRGRCGGTQKGPSAPARFLASGGCFAVGGIGPTGGLIVAVEHVWVEVEPVRPNDRTQLGVDSDPPEVLRIAQWLGHRSPEDVSEIDDTLAVVVELQAQAIRLQGLDV